MSDELRCRICGSGLYLVHDSEKGKVWRCVRYPACKYIRGETPIPP